MICWGVTSIGSFWINMSDRTRRVIYSWSIKYSRYFQLWAGLWPGLVQETFNTKNRNYSTPHWPYPLISPNTGSSNDEDLYCKNSRTVDSIRKYIKSRVFRHIQERACIDGRRRKSRGSRPLAQLSEMIISTEIFLGFNFSFCNVS